MDMYERKAELIVTDRQNFRRYIGKAYNKVIESLVDPASNMTEEEKKQYDQKIMAKLRNGKHLTVEELNYLKIHNPVMYRIAMRVEMVKQRLKEQLSHCKSKEEANDIIFGAISGISDKDPDKEYLVAGIQETAKNFRKDSKYARLPDTIEQSKKKRTKEINHFDDEEESVGNYTPIIEVIEALPTFDVVQ